LLGMLTWNGALNKKKKQKNKRKRRRREEGG
jgi:hypothetical protein